MLPQWLQTHLENIGAANADGVARRARAGTCTQCNRRVLRGLDADMCALAVEMDAQEIDHAGELLALLRGMHTYDLVKVGGRWEINARHDYHMTIERPWPVMPEHKCGNVYPIPREPHARFVLPPRKPDQADPPF